jgi:hypothetical protein
LGLFATDGFTGSASVAVLEEIKAEDAVITPRDFRSSRRFTFISNVPNDCAAARQKSDPLLIHADNIVYSHSSVSLVMTELLDHATV